MQVVTIDNTTMSLWELQGKRLRMEQQPYWSRDDIEVVVARVNRGATRLDTFEGPKWTERIFPASLKMSNGQFCIIGQAYDGYGKGIGLPFGIEDYSAGEGDPVVDQKAIDHGFLTGVLGEKIPYGLLDRVWVYMLTARSENRGPVFLNVPAPLKRNVMDTLLAAAGLLQTVEEVEVEGFYGRPE